MNLYLKKKLTTTLLNFNKFNFVIMKWHYNLLIGIVNGLEKIFLQNNSTNKVIEGLIDKNKKWGSRD